VPQPFYEMVDNPAFEVASTVNAAVTALENNAFSIPAAAAGVLLPF